MCKCREAERERERAREREREREKGWKEEQGWPWPSQHAAIVSRVLFGPCFVCGLLVVDCATKRESNHKRWGRRARSRTTTTTKLQWIAARITRIEQPTQKKAFHVRDIQTCSIGSPWIGPVRFRPLMPSLTKLCKVAPGKKEKE